MQLISYFGASEREEINCFGWFRTHMQHNGVMLYAISDFY